MAQMQQRIVKKIRYTKFSSIFPGFNTGTLLVAIFCSFLIVISTFSPIPLRIVTIPEEALTNSIEFFSNLKSIDQITRVLSYIPQVPVIIMIASMLGPKMSMLSVLLYLVTGLAGFPVFASGGGLHYLLKIRFGYILGFFAGAFVTGKLLSKNTNKLSIIKAAIIGVIAIHIIGTIYLAIVLLFERESIYAIIGWILQLTGMQIFYDIIFAIIAAFIGRLLRHLLWVATD